MSPEPTKELSPPAETPDVKPAISLPRVPKRKSVSDTIADATEKERHTRLKMTEVNAKQKTTRALGTAKYKQDAKIEVKKMELAFQREENNYQRQHELAVLEKQIELERLRRQPVQIPSVSTPNALSAPQGPIFSPPLDPAFL